MRSGNGRHRRPRQAPALVVAAGVAGSAIAIPLLGATGANAAETTTWDRVAECESGGMWSADLGNGYYGGLQFSQETWESNGGTAYAPRADLASRSQQIQIAEKVLADQGPKAWPSCATISGLVEGDDTPPGDGATAEPAPSETSDSPDASEGSESLEDIVGSDSGAAKTKKADEADKADKVEESEEPAGSDASEPAKPSDATPAGETTPPAPEKSAPSGKHRGEEAREENRTDAAAGNSGNKYESGRHASRGDGSPRDAANATNADKAGNAGEGEYTVRTGDNLWSIADAHDVPGGWPALYEANEKAIGSDADLILPGQSLDLS
ncbi:transglycosylase family protein [Streptomyces sp. ISL-98]|uniref:transglycosylase family protein n=1 Tax=Streptomyces sp. ISL-98 TaxID=2819192 RepID=UPI001BE92163|nr:transglycosylase family protein [Streptomyces sp. ISL-98]MBT2505612.1 transglycosylase family protein [Streptomyces sp. ISL-98]